jgi:1-acyl-sn-glycerol-3-phosphate acyltransferase
MKAKIRLCCKLALIVLLFFIGFLIASGLFPTINILFSPRTARKQRDAIKIIWLRWFSAIVKLRIVKRGAIPSQPVLLASNHISWLDIIVLGQFLPGCFVAKNDISRWPVIGFLSRQAGTIFIRRGDKKQILETAEKMAWVLKQNGSIFAFPEGTTTNGDEVLGFHASLFQPALLTKSAIQPVALQYSGAAKEMAPYIGEDIFVPHLLQILTLDKIEVTLSFLPLIDNWETNRNAVSAETRKMISEALYSDNFTTDSNPICLNTGQAAAE